MKKTKKNKLERFLGKTKFFLLFSLILVSSFYILDTSALAATGVPKILNHQGRLFDSSGNLLGGAGTNYCFRFSIYDDGVIGGGDIKLWPSGTPTTSTVMVRGGVFNALIGDVSNGGDLLDFNFQDNDSSYLNVEVAAQPTSTCSGVSFETLGPRPRIVASGYAVNASTLSGFTASQLPTGSNIPVLASGDLTLADTNPQINATGTNTLTLQGGAGTGDILFFGSANRIASSGAITIAGALTAANVSQAVLTTSSPTFAGLSLTGGLSAATTTLTDLLSGANINLSGGISAATRTVAGLTVSSFTTGSVIFAGAAGVLSQSNSNFFWKDASRRLAIGTSTPSARLTVVGADTSATAYALTAADLNGTALFSVRNDGTISVGKSGTTSTVAGNFRVVGGSALQGLTFTNATGTTLSLSSSGATSLRIAQSGGQPFAEFDNGAGIEQFRVDSAGSVFANGFIAKQMQFSDEFVRFRANIVADTAGGGTTGMGDNFAWGAGELGTCTWSTVADATNGVQRQTVGTTGDGCLTYLSEAAANPRDILNVANKPIIVMKLRPSAVNVDNQVFAGMMDYTDGSTALPTNGVYFSNEGGTTWVGVARSGGSQNTVTCTGQTISTTQDAYFRIAASSTSYVEFFMDSDTSDGIDTVSCGAVTSTIPAIDLTAEIMNQFITAGAGVAMDLDVDFVRINQDDPIASGVSSPSSPFDPSAGADIAEEVPAFDTDNIEAGDVLSIVRGLDVMVALTEKAYDETLYGVVTTNPGMILGSGASSTVRAALAGRVPVKVNLEGGPIQAGDWLTSSSKKGEAMKATRSGMVLGRGLQSFDGGGAENKILMYVNLQDWKSTELAVSSSGPLLADPSGAVYGAKEALAELLAVVGDSVSGLADWVGSKIVAGIGG